MLVNKILISTFSVVLYSKVCIIIMVYSIYIYIYYINSTNVCVDWDIIIYNKVL